MAQYDVTVITKNSHQDLVEALKKKATSSCKVPAISTMTISVFHYSHYELQH